MTRIKVFVDFWNMQLDWNSYLGKDAKGNPVRIPWTKLPDALCNAVKEATNSEVTYSGTHVYASVDPNGAPGLKNFLSNIMNGFPGYTVVVKERKARSGGVRCRECKHEITNCPECKEPLRRTVEKGVDSAILTEMIQMGFDDVYDAAILCSADADLGQGVEFIHQRTKKKVYNLWFPGVGMTLKNKCWDSIRVDDLLKTLAIKRN